MMYVPVDSAERPRATHSATLSRFGSGTGWAEWAEAGPKLKVLRIAATNPAAIVTAPGAKRDVHLLQTSLKLFRNILLLRGSVWRCSVRDCHTVQSLLSAYC